MVFRWTISLPWCWWCISIIASRTNQLPQPTMIYGLLMNPPTRPLGVTAAIGVGGGKTATTTTKATATILAPPPPQLVAPSTGAGNHNDDNDSPIMDHSRHSRTPLPSTYTTTTTTTSTIPLPVRIVTKQRSVVTKDIKMPDPIPTVAHADVLDLLRSGRLYRYGTAPDHNSPVSLCEREVTAYTGHKYCVAVNSCGSALFLLLKTTLLPLNGKVLTNAFTFGAVPSAIEHAGGRPVYVESTMDMVLDVTDLANKLIDHPDCHHVLISHMRGKVGNMAEIRRLCDQHEAVLLEDCAHSLGVCYDHRHSGHVGVACAISSQSYKMLNSGEGGFVLTDDADIAARAAVYAGAYEGLASKHLTVPPVTAFGDYPQTLPNYSLRLSNLAAAVIRPQLSTLDVRIAIYQGRYDRLVRTLQQRVGRFLTIPRLDPAVTRMVHDSLQFTLDATAFADDKLVQTFLDECASHGLPVERFGHPSNCRNYVNWKFAPADSPLPQTTAMLRRSCDVRLPLMWSDDDFVDLANVLCESIEHVVAVTTVANKNDHLSNDGGVM